MRYQLAGTTTGRHDGSEGASERSDAVMMKPALASICIDSTVGGKPDAHLSLKQELKP